MALTPPRSPETTDEPEDSSRRAQPIRPVWQGALLWLVGLAVLLVIAAVIVRSLVVPELTAGSTAPSAADAHLSALQTQEALTPKPTVVPTQAPTAVPPSATTAPTPQPTSVAPVATAAPTPAAATTNPGAAATPRPTVPPELSAEVSQAYLRYFQVTADAFLNLDPSSLSEVAVDGELTALEKNISDLRSQGRALSTNVQHNFVVISVDGDQAQVADQYRDSSLFVDPSTHDPLPGQDVPNSPDTAPLVKVVYQLQRVDGTWKVAGGTRYE